MFLLWFGLSHPSFFGFTQIGNGLFLFNLFFFRNFLFLFLYFIFWFLFVFFAILIWVNVITNFKIVVIIIIFLIIIVIFIISINNPFINYFLVNILFILITILSTSLGRIWLVLPFPPIKILSIWSIMSDLTLQFTIH